MFSGHRISVVIPCHNEEEGVRAVIERMPRPLVDEVVVVNNASTDRTEEVALAMGANVVREEKKGYGHAYRAGLAAATGDIIVTMDGDGTYPPDAIQLLLLVFLEKKIDFMTAQRWRPVRGRRRLSLRILGNAVLSVSTMLLFRRFIWDSQSGMWVFWSGHRARLQPRSTGMAFSQEIKILAFTDPDLSCLEMPIFYGDHRVGVSKLNLWRDGFGNLFHLLRMRLSLARQRREQKVVRVPVAGAVQETYA
jgi:glycosyltransferase involved in cell wall biosynthesis